MSKSRTGPTAIKSKISGSSLALLEQETKKFLGDQVVGSRSILNMLARALKQLLPHLFVAFFYYKEKTQETD